MGEDTIHDFAENYDALYGHDGFHLYLMLVSCAFNLNI